MRSNYQTYNPFKGIYSTPTQGCYRSTLKKSGGEKNKTNLLIQEVTYPKILLVNLEGALDDIQKYIKGRLWRSLVESLEIHTKTYRNTSTLIYLESIKKTIVTKCYVTNRLPALQ